MIFKIKWNYSYQTLLHNLKWDCIIKDIVEDRFNFFFFTLMSVLHNDVQNDQ